ncbi:TonB-dependent siderophore receptor [Achromobacter aloeverae]|uniref:TonB-dependent siderophore receptor n=2 Tax=Achromobacter aloeverae TaxID=1750518 RepID=A0A4Q1HC14_9BURK|nr:TonB-dependent siderophore receptor [Achromobacter aloeverae]
MRPLSLALAMRAALTYAALGAAPLVGNAWAQATPDTTTTTTLAPVSVVGTATTQGDVLPPAYAGGQVAKGGRMGVLGEQDAANVPFSVTSFTSKLIEDQQAKSLGDVLRNDSSVQITKGYGNDAQLFVVRGFALNGDDISYGGLYGVMPRQILSTQGIERVELFKGPSAFLNGVPPGGSGIGGMVNIEPKRADDEPLTRVGLDYSSSSQVGVSADVARRFGASKQFGIRVNALQREGDVGIGDESQRMTFGSVGLDYRGERLRASLDLGYQKQHTSQGRPMVRVQDGFGIPDAPSARHDYAQPWTYSETENTFGMAKVEYDLADNWTAFAGFGMNHANEYGSYSSLNVDGKGNSTSTRMDVPYVSDTFGLMTGVRGKFDTGPVSHAVTVAFSSNYLKKRSAYVLSSGFATSLYDTPAVAAPTGFPYKGGNMSDPGVTARSRMSGTSVSDTLSFLDDRVLFTAGIRHQDLTTTNYDYTGAVGSSYDRSANSPVYGLVVKPVEHLSLYANHIEGLQQGDTAPNTSNTPGRILPPGKSKQNEAGAKLDMDNYGASLAIFQIEKEVGLLHSNGDFTAAGRQRNRGIELNVFGEPVRGVRLLSGITFIDPKLTKTGDDTEGNKAPGVPKYTAVLGGEWDLPWVSGLTLQGRVNHAGTQYLDAENTQKLKPYTTLDLGVRYAMKVDSHDVVWRLGVDNVFNKAYWASAWGGYLTQGDPRTAKLSVSFDF